MMSDHNHVDDEFFDANQVVEKSPFAAAARRGGGAEDEVMIENGRGKKDLSLDDCSFELANCSTSLSSVDFNRMMKQEQEDGAGVGGQALRKRYFDEVSSFVKTKLGCDNVICYQQTFNDSDVTHNNSQDGTYDDMSELYKNECPHTDSSTRSSDELALSLLAAEQRGHHNMYQRYVDLSLLRYIEPEENDDVMTTTVYRHLALLDERTAVKPDDYEKAEVKRDGGRAMAEQCYMLSTRHASNHKWFYFPSMEMQKDVILIKQMDSDWTKSGRMSFRMNVNDPTRRRNSSIEERVMLRTRKSTEVRMVCYWKQTANGINSMPTPEDVRIRIGVNTPHPTRTSSNVTPVRRHPVINLSPSGVQDNRSWLEKLMDGESKVNEWMGKIESISTGLLDSTENLTLSDVVAKCQAGAAGSNNNKPDEKGFLSASITNNLEGYWGRYQKTYDDSYDDKYKREYLDKFVSVVETFPSWPPSSKSWVRSEMRKFGHREVDRGIAEITCVIVDDSMGLVGTGNLPTSEKKKIIDFLIRSEIYMHVALKHWGDLAQDANALHSHSMIQEEGPVPVTPRGGQHLDGRRQAMINSPQYQQGMMMVSNAGRFEQNPYGEEVDYSMTNKNVHSLELQHHLMEQNNNGYDEQNRDDDQQTPYPVMQPEGRRDALLSHYIGGSQDQQNANGGHANKSTAVPPPPSSYYYNVDAPYNKQRHNQQQQRVGEVADPWDERTPSM